VTRALLVLGGGVGAEVTVSAYLVAGPGSPADPLSGLTVALPELGNTAADSATAGTWAVAAGPVLACPDGPGGLCVSIG
jgi:hypothetical protein